MNGKRSQIEMAQQPQTNLPNSAQHVIEPLNLCSEKSDSYTEPVDLNVPVARDPAVDRKFEILRPLVQYHNEQELRDIMQILQGLLTNYSIKELGSIVRFNSAFQPQKRFKEDINLPQKRPRLESNSRKSRSSIVDVDKEELEKTLMDKALTQDCDYEPAKVQSRKSSDWVDPENPPAEAIIEIEEFDKALRKQKPLTQK